MVRHLATTWSLHLQDKIAFNIKKVMRIDSDVIDIFEEKGWSIPLGTKTAQTMTEESEGYSYF